MTFTAKDCSAYNMVAINICGWSYLMVDCHVDLALLNLAALAKLTPIVWLTKLYKGEPRHFLLQMAYNILAQSYLELFI